jgi:hypothetical protein
MLVLGLSAIRHRLRLSHLALAGAVLVVVAALAPPTVWQRIETLAKPVTSGSRETGAVVDTSVELRLGAQQTALEIFLAHPFVGAGSGNFPPLYQDVSRRLGVKAVGTEYFPHNLYLEILAELGVVGLTAFAAMVYALWAGLRRSMPSAVDARASAHSLRELSFGIEAALVGYLAGMVLLQGSYPRYFWMLLALVVVATRASRDVAIRPNAERVAGAGVAPRPARSFAGAPASTGSSGFGGNGEHQVKVPQASHDGSPDALVGGQQAGGCSDVSPAIAPIVLRATGPGRTAGRQEGRTVAPSLGRAYAQCGLVIQRLTRFQPIPSRLSVSRTVSSLTRSSGRLRSMLNLGDEIQCPRTRRHPVLGMMRLPSLTRWWDRARGPN